MNKFGLACEGITDHITIRNILCGYFDNLELKQNIKFKQPLASSDTTDQVKNNGGWRNLLAYLESDIFREDVENFEFMVIQVDTDISNDGDEKFDVPHYDSDNHLLSTETLINNVTEKLILTIDKNDAGFYQYYSERIIFAVSVHSIECWLVAHYSGQVETEECFKILGTIRLPKKIPITKKHNGRSYHRLSKPFLKRKNIDLVAKKNISFKVFIQELGKVC